jgi:hypothetical protein
MIIHLKSDLQPTALQEWSSKLKALSFLKDGKRIMVTEASVTAIPAEFEQYVDEFWVFNNDIQLASKKYRSNKRSVKIGAIEVGGTSNNNILIGGSLYYYRLTMKNKVKGKRADFIVNGYVYTVGSKAQAYPKKANEFGGMIVESYKDDKNYWLAKNSNAQLILLKKSDVTIL